MGASYHRVRIQGKTLRIVRECYRQLQQKLETRWLYVGQMSRFVGEECPFFVDKWGKMLINRPNIR